MVSKEKIYKYNNRTLQYSEDVNSFNKKIVRGLRFLLVSSGMAVCITIIALLTFGSPIELLIGIQTSNYKKDFNLLNSNIDSLHHQLHSEIFPADEYYREVLHLDSLPTPIRFAGTGGSDPYDTLNGLHYKEIIASTLQKIDVLFNQLNVQNESYDYVLDKAQDHTKKFAQIPTIRPIKPSKNTYTSSSFGSRRDPFTHKRKSHSGLDIVGPKNTEIYATADGIVTITKESRTGYGKEVVILHNFGYSTRYAHLNKILISEGAKIKRGQLIGLMGSTGRSTGTHLHYEVRLHNRPVNPIYYFSDDLTEVEYELITKLNNTGDDKEDGKAQL